MTSRTASVEGLFIELYRAEFPYVWKSARRLGVSRAEADDVVQETFVIVHRLLRGTYEPKGSPRSWLFAVLFRVVQRHRRSHRRRTARTDDDANIEAIAASSACAPDRSAETTETVRILEAILDKLDPDKRAVLVLADIEEMPIAEIAEILGINEHTATSRLRLAREHLDAGLARHRARDGWRLNVSTEPGKKRLALLPLASIYEPEDVDAARVLEKVRASVDAEVAAHSHASSPAQRGTLFKLAAASCVALALIGAVVVRQRGADRAPPSVASPTAKIAATSAQATKDEPSTPRDSSSLPSMPTVAVGALPSAPAKAIATAANTSMKPSPSAEIPAAAAPNDTLEKEARLLADARHASAGGESERALALLDEHARAFPNGWLAADRAAERVVVLCSLGRRDEAVRAGKVFLDSHPRSSHARRVATSCAGEP